MKVLVTGASGFIGSHLVALLGGKGYEVSALVRNSSNLKALDGLECQIVYGDILDPESLNRAMNGCELIFHVAGIFSYWGVSETEMRSVAVEGTRNVLNAAKKAGIRRIVLTSTSVVLGPGSAQQPANEKSRAANLDDEPPYIHTKIEQEDAAFDYARTLGLDLVSVLPTLTVGSKDYKLTESNRMIAAYLKDPFKASWIGGCNIVSVDDVVNGHLLIAEKGTSGQRYILGGDNLEWQQVHKIISQLTGLPGPYLTANHTSAYLAATVHEIISLFTREAPQGSRAQSKMVGKYYWYDHSKAANLGYKPMPAREALVRAVSWLVTSEHIPSALRAEMQLAGDIYRWREKAGIA